MSRIWLVCLVIGALGACSEGVAPSLPPPGPGATPITIVTKPAGAAVTVNGVAVGLSPVTVQLKPGPQRLRASMSGYYPAPELPIVVERGTAATHEITLMASH